MSVVARLLHIHPQTIRHYERLGLLAPFRTAGNVRLFSEGDIRRLRQINELTEMGVNLAGVEIIVRLVQRIEQMQRDASVLRQEVDHHFRS
jgi:MerR family transcriptional regulator/heat shock protein HspR